MKIDGIPARVEVAHTHDLIAKVTLDDHTTDNLTVLIVNVTVAATVLMVVQKILR
jgi:hypothetical protein